MPIAGVHAFIVPLRDNEGKCLPGIHIKDCGYKVCNEASALRSVTCGIETITSVPWKVMPLA